MEVLVVILVVYRPGGQPLSLFLELPGGNRGDYAAVQTSGQKAAQRHIADKLPLDCVRHKLPDMRGGFREILTMSLRMH